PLFTVSQSPRLRLSALAKNSPLISPDMRHELPVWLPQVLTSAWPQSQSEYKIVRPCSKRASRILAYRVKVLDLVQSYPAGAGLERPGQVPFADLLEG